MKSLSEIKNLGDREGIVESKKELPDPPMIIVLKRKAIRLFPSGKRVALYHNDKLGVDISIPYSPNHIGAEISGVGVNEENLVEKAHDDLFGEYTNALEQHHKMGSRGTHPELAKLQTRVHQKYGKQAAGHFHAAAEGYLNGDFHGARRHYAKFERKIDESFEDVVVDVEPLQEAVIHKLHHITKTKQAGDVKFSNGASARVEYPQAAHILKLHTQLSPQNRNKIETLVNSGPAGLQRVADFAAENLK